MITESSNCEVGDEPEEDIDNGADDDPVRMMKGVKMIRMEQCLKRLNGCCKTQ